MRVFLRNAKNPFCEREKMTLHSVASWHIYPFIGAFVSFFQSYFTPVKWGFLVLFYEPIRINGMEIIFQCEKEHQKHRKGRKRTDFGGLFLKAFVIFCVFLKKCLIAGTLHRSAPSWTKMMKITEDNLSLLRFVY